MFSRIRGWLWTVLSRLGRKSASGSRPTPPQSHDANRFIPTLTELTNRETPAFLAVVSGNLELYGAGGDLLRIYPQVVEPTAVPFQVAASPDGLSAVLGAGAGGGPRVIGVDLKTGSITFSEFIGNPADRAGVGVAWLNVAPAAGLVVQGEPSAPADAAAVQRVTLLVNQLPQKELQYLALHGIQVDVYAGNEITDDPTFASFIGQQTGALGDGGRTYDQVPAVFTGHAAYVNGHVDIQTVAHELGHGAQTGFTASQESEWLDIYNTTTFPNDYEQLNQGEALAQSVMRWSLGYDQPDPRINPFLDGVFG